MARPAGVVTRLAAPVGSHAAGMLMTACAAPTAAASALSCFSRARVSSENIGLSKLDLVGVLWQAASAARLIIPITARDTDKAFKAARVKFAPSVSNPDRFVRIVAPC